VHGLVALSRPLTVERLPGPEALAGIAAEWDLLDQRTEPRTPFTSPAWIIPWWQHFCRHRQLLFHDEFFCHLVRDEARRLVAVAPLMLTSAPGIGPPVLRMVQFFGTDPFLTEIRGVICRPEDQAAVIEVLVEHFSSRRNEWDVFRWNGLHRASDTHDALGLRCTFMPRRDVRDYVMDLPANWEQLRLQVSSNMRKNLRKAYESLERAGLSFSLRVSERPEDVAGSVDRFLALHAARAQVRDMIPHPYRFGQTRARAFIDAYLLGVAERGELRIFELEIGGAVVASRLAFVLGDDLYMYYAGYDPAWKNYSVMTVLVSEMIKWAFARGLRRVNLSTGNDQSKDRWKPREVMFRDAVQLSPTRRARAAFGAFRAYEAMGQVRGRAPTRS
jgi:CelD/BcsL family acetyltransferase involved in cellulose biosynthesis